MSQSHMEYKEVQIPEEIVNRMREISGTATPEKPATFGAAGVFDWLNEQSREGGWRVVWQGFNFPFVVLEREVWTTTDKES